MKYLVEADWLPFRRAVIEADSQSEAVLAGAKLWRCLPEFVSAAIWNDGDKVPELAPLKTKPICENENASNDTRQTQTPYLAGRNGVYF